MTQRNYKTSEEENQTYYTGAKEEYEPEMEDLLEKNDMKVMILSALGTILPIALLVLLAMVVPAMLFFRLF